MLTDPLLAARGALAPPVARWCPRTAPRSLLIGLHSFSDFRLSFEEIGPWLADRGHVLLSYDVSGAGENGPFGLFPGTDVLVDELVATVTAARLERHWRDLPLVLVGESAGASLALVATGRGRVAPDGLVLASPGVVEGGLARTFWDAIIFGAEAIAPGAAVSVKRDDPGLSARARARLMGDTRVVRDIRADTYAGIVRMAHEASDRAPAVACPTLILHGADDPLITQSSVEALAEAIPAPVRLRTFDGLGHLVLQVRDPAPVWGEVAAFLDGIAAP